MKTTYCGSTVCNLRLRLFAKGDKRLPPPCKDCLAALREDVEREAAYRGMR